MTIFSKSTKIWLSIPRNTEHLDRPSSTWTEYSLFSLRIPLQRVTVPDTFLHFLCRLIIIGMYYANSSACFCGTFNRPLKVGTNFRTWRRKRRMRLIADNSAIVSDFLQFPCKRQVIIWRWRMVVLQKGFSAPIIFAHRKYWKIPCVKSCLSNILNSPFFSYYIGCRLYFGWYFHSCITTFTILITPTILTIWKLILKCALTPTVFLLRKFVNGL